MQSEWLHFFVCADIINPMEQYHTNNKNNPTGMIAAPIMIGDEKYVYVVEVIANDYMCMK